MVEGDMSELARSKAGASSWFVQDQAIRRSSGVFVSLKGVA